MRLACLSVSLSVCPVGFLHQERSKTKTDVNCVTGVTGVPNFVQKVNGQGHQRSKCPKNNAYLA